MHPKINSSVYLPRYLLDIYNSRKVRNHNEYADSFILSASKNAGDAPGAIYTKKGKRWLAKIGYHFEESKSHNLASSQSIPENSLTNRAAMLNCAMEKIATDFYYILAQGAFLTATTRLINKKFVNEHTKNNGLVRDLMDRINEPRAISKQISEGLHLFCKFIDDYLPINEDIKACYNNKQFSFMEFIIEFRRPPEYLSINGNIMRLVGLMEILAISRLVHDTDTLGEEFGNLGIKIIKDNSGELVAKAVKIDPGSSFCQDEWNLFLNSINSDKINATKGEDELNFKFILRDLRDIQYSNNRSRFEWKHLTDIQKKEFLTALGLGINILRNTIILDFLIYREGKFNSYGKVLSLKSNYALELFDLISDNINELEKIYTADSSFLLKDDSFVNPYTNAKLATDQNFVIVTPGPLAQYKSLKKCLDSWNENPLAYTNNLKKNEMKVMANIEVKQILLNAYMNEDSKISLAGYSIATLPVEVFSHFANITEIDMSRNSLTSLPSTISCLPRLNIINLTNNPLSNFQDLACKFKKLRPKLILEPKKEEKLLLVLLDVWKNAQECPKSELADRDKAKKILLAAYHNKNINSISLEGLSSIPCSVLKYIENLKYLDLRKNQFAADYVPYFIPLHIELTLTEQQEECFVSAKLESWIKDAPKDEEATRIKAHNLIYQCYSKQYSDLDLSGLNLSELPDGVFRYFKKLRSLNLSCNKLSYLPDDICKLTKLISLNLEHNQFHQFPSGVKLLIELAELNLSSNNLFKFPEEISELIHLQELYLARNKIRTLPNHIDNLRSLRIFSLNGNYLEYIPASLSNIVCLENLELADNQLQELPANIGLLTKLKVLDLTKNSLNKLPISIKRLGALEVLRLSQNQFIIVPDEITKLKKLTSLSLRGNMLKSIPNNIDELVNLKNLFIMDNNISELPPSIYKLKNLATIDFTNNPVRGVSALVS